MRPSPYTAFMAVGVKTAAFAAFARLLLDGLGPAYASWHYAAWVLAAATMVVGNVLALVQQNVKRMLAYSSIAHAGYLLVAITSHSAEGVAAIVFYALAYTLATVGAFGVLSIVSGGIEKRTRLVDLAGLSRTRPALATAMAVFMLSLMGFPIAGGMGFFAKWYVLRAALALTGTAAQLAIVLVLASLVAAGYYLKVVATMFMQPPADADSPPRVVGGATDGGVIAVAAMPPVGPRCVPDAGGALGEGQHAPRSRLQAACRRHRRRAGVRTLRFPARASMTIAAGIFRQYDIRGVVGDDLTVEAAEGIGRAYAALLDERGLAGPVAGRPRQPAQRHRAPRCAGARSHDARSRRDRHRRRPDTTAVLVAAPPAGGRWHPDHRLAQPAGVQRIQDLRRHRVAARCRDPASARPARAHPLRHGRCRDAARI